MINEINEDLTIERMLADLRWIKQHFRPAEKRPLTAEEKNKADQAEWKKIKRNAEQIIKEAEDANEHRGRASTESEKAGEQLSQDSEVVLVVQWTCRKCGTETIRVGDRWCRRCGLKTDG